ncbi:MAG: AIR synthase-related protein, partial [Candidatus Hodarchaeota archaeon]
ESQKRNGEAIRALIKNKLVSSCKPVGRGGVLVTCLKMLFKAEGGLTLTLSKIPSPSDLTNTELLCSETYGRYLVEFKPENLEKFTSELLEREISFAIIGKRTERRVFRVHGSDIDIDSANALWDSIIPKFMGE